MVEQQPFMLWVLGLNPRGLIEIISWLALLLDTSGCCG